MATPQNPMPLVAASDAAITVDASDDTPAQPRLGLRILVVDDNHDSAESMRSLLEILGNDVVTANEGRQALQCIAQRKPDVALLDIGMPKMNGYEVARRIRGESYGDEILLIAMTGWGQEEDRLRSRSAGFDHHLVKPVDLVELKRLLDERVSRITTPLVSSSPLV